MATLFAWLSPSYPIGAFSYSHGLETAIAAEKVVDAESLHDWLSALLAFGAGRTDAIFLAEAYRRTAQTAEGDLQNLPDLHDLHDLIELADALQPSAERRLETMAQGRAFAETTAAAYGGSAVVAPYPVALGCAAARHGFPLETACALFLHAFVANLVSAGVRLVPLGQTEGQRLLAALQPTCREVSEEALQSTLDDIGGCAFGADVASMRHEIQEVRLFRS